MYESFQILIDDPAATLALGFDDYAAALAEVATVSRPQFAIGIFGPWGSGKSTLMKAIRTDVAKGDDVVPIWFNAWRYEKEEHLIVPLLDSLREQILEWGEKPERPVQAAGKARDLAATLGRAAKAVLAGLTLKAGIPGAVDLSLDANRVASAWRESRGAAAAASEPKSFYHAAFLALRASVDDFLTEEPGPGTRHRRIIVFVDDIDRCLPRKALEVLESMKLFFDLEGFVFIVGLDQRVIEQAVHLKYPATGLDTLGEAATYITGADYVKKIFQVQFTAPRIDRSQLESFVNSVAEAEALPPEQRDDLRWNVVPQIGNLAGTSSVNPREVKRLINAYTLQMKILERKLLDLHRAPSANAVLALQIMSFRQDWQAAYNALSNSPTDFVDAVNYALPLNQTTIAVEDEVLELPLSLLSFLQNDGQTLLSVGDDLELYVSALESARSTDPTAREISQTLGRIRVAHKSATPDSARDLRGLLDELASRLSIFSVAAARATSARVAKLVQDYPGAQATSVGPDDMERWLETVGRELPMLSQEVNELRRRTATAATSAA